MMLKPLSLAAAGLAVAAQAFLLPPDVSESDINIANSLPVTGPVTGPNTYTTKNYAFVNVSCPGCLSFDSARHHGRKGAVDRPSHLELAFAINHEATPETLELNAFQLYPRANPFLYPLTAPVVANDRVRAVVKELRGHRPRPLPMETLGYQLSVGQRALNAEDGLTLLELNLQIIEVGDVFVDGIPSVQVTLVKDINTGALAIGTVTTSDSAVPAPTDEEDDECTGFMCKWLAAVKDNMAKMKGKPCHGKMRSSSKGPRPHHGGHHHHPNPTPEDGSRHHQWSQHRSWGLFFKNVVQHIVLPIVVGIVAGVSVSLIGMMVGTLIVALWRTFFRRPSQRQLAHSYSASKASEAELAAAEVEEKSGLMEHQEPPPSYGEEAVKH